MSIEVVFEKRIHNVNVCRDVDAVQRRQYFLLTLLSSIFVIGLLLYGWQQYRWINLGYQIEKANGRKEALLDHQRNLAVQRESLAQPGVIESAARGMGLVAAAPGQIVTLADEAAAPLTASTGAR